MYLSRGNPQIDDFLELSKYSFSVEKISAVDRCTAMHAGFHLQTMSQINLFKLHLQPFIDMKILN